MYNGSNILFTYINEPQTYTWYLVDMLLFLLLAYLGGVQATSSCIAVPFGTVGFNGQFNLWSEDGSLSTGSTYNKGNMQTYAFPDISTSTKVSFKGYVESTDGNSQGSLKFVYTGDNGAAVHIVLQRNLKVKIIVYESSTVLNVLSSKYGIANDGLSNMWNLNWRDVVFQFELVSTKSTDTGDTVQLKITYTEVSTDVHGVQTPTEKVQVVPALDAGSALALNKLVVSYDSTHASLVQNTGDYFQIVGPLDEYGDTLPAFSACGTFCDGGEFFSKEDETCKNCIAGKYQDESSQSTCKYCAAGTYNWEPGKIDCIPCDAGTFNWEPGKTDCIDCGPGMYNEESGKTDCIDCAAGRYNEESRKTDCKDCAAGTYSTDYGSATADSCIECASGTYNDESGKTDCKNCSPGKTNVGAGNTNENTCKSGSELSEASGPALLQALAQKLTC